MIRKSGTRTDPFDSGHLEQVGVMVSGGTLWGTPIQVLTMLFQGVPSIHMGGTPPAPGHSPLLEENYTVLEALGLGAAGRVLRASRKKDGKEVPKRGKRSFHQWGIPNMVAL